MKSLYLAAAVALSIGAAPAFAGEGNGDPFPFSAGGQTTRTYAAPQQYADTGSQAYPHVAGRPGTGLDNPAGSQPQFADTGSQAYPNITGRAGSDLPSLAGNVLPTNGSQGIVQTANSLPAHFEDGTVPYMQAARVRNWMVAHAQRPSAVASTAQRAPGG
jgi:hypothetical protein